MTGEAEVTKWISPETERRASQAARDRANAARWDLDIAVFLFAVLIIIIILLFGEVGIQIVAPVAVFGLAMVWLVGWRRGRQLYQRFYDEELPKYMVDWKDYYEILRVSPSAESEAIIAAYEHSAHAYHDALSDKTQEIPFFSLMMREVNEAYQILSDPIMRTAYDHVFWMKYNGESEESTKKEIIELVELVAQDVSESKRRVNWRIPQLSKVTQRAILIAVISLLLILFGGTSIAFAKPEHPLATPFRGIAITVVKTSSGAISLIEHIRGVIATYERNIVSTALQSMRVEEGLKRVPSVTVLTNDMARFPSREHRLFPDYIEKRFTQFKYTVNSKGSVIVDTSWATTDAFLEKIKRLLDRLEKENRLRIGHQ